MLLKKDIFKCSAKNIQLRRKLCPTLCFRNLTVDFGQGHTSTLTQADICLYLIGIPECLDSPAWPTKKPAQWWHNVRNMLQCFRFCNLYSCFVCVSDNCLLFCIDSLSFLSGALWHFLCHCFRMLLCFDGKNYLNVWPRLLRGLLLGSLVQKKTLHCQQKAIVCRDRNFHTLCRGDLYVRIWM